MTPAHVEAIVYRIMAAKRMGISLGLGAMKIRSDPDHQNSVAAETCNFDNEDDDGPCALSSNNMEA